MRKIFYNNFKITLSVLAVLLLIVIIFLSYVYYEGNSPLSVITRMYSSEYSSDSTDEALKVYRSLYTNNVKALDGFDSSFGGYLIYLKDNKRYKFVYDRKNGSIISVSIKEVK